MGQGDRHLDPAILTPGQRAVLAAWPAFVAAAAVCWANLDVVVRLIGRADSLAQLPDAQAYQLATFLRTATARLLLVAPASPRPAAHRGQA